MTKDLALTIFRALVMVARAIAREYGFPWPPKGNDRHGEPCE